MRLTRVSVTSSTGGPHLSLTLSGIMCIVRLNSRLVTRRALFTMCPDTRSWILTLTKPKLRETDAHTPVTPRNAYRPTRHTATPGGGCSPHAIPREQHITQMRHRRCACMRAAGASGQTGRTEAIDGDFVVSDFDCSIPKLRRVRAVTSQLLKRLRKRGATRVAVGYYTGSGYAVCSPHSTAAVNGSPRQWLCAPPQP